MTYLSWLHLTDFHQGMKEQDRLWPNVKDRFFRDLEYLYRKCGVPWDLVLFTGDLTQTGDAQEFESINQLLNELWSFFENQLHFSNLPKLLAVPGNHDLIRPKPRTKDPDYNEAVDILTHSWDEKTWDTTAKRRTTFWEQSNSRYRQVIQDAFANYIAWWNEHPYRPKEGINDGILPGDFSYTFKKDDASLGVLGLNTSFLQLTSDDYERRLALDTLQFHRACLGDGSTWVKQHNACLLMTHHPSTWLCPDSRQQLQQEIITDYFAVHLCGHLHEATYQDIAEGGGEAQHTWQGRSLFGLEDFGEKRKLKRSHGYTAGIIKLNGDRGRLVFFPRESRLQGKYRNIVPDYHFNLNDQQHTNPREFKLQKTHKTFSSSELLTATKNDAQDLNIQKCRTVVESILEQHLQLKHWKKLHKELQKLSCDLLHMRMEIIYYEFDHENILIYVGAFYPRYRDRIGKLIDFANIHEKIIEEIEQGNFSRKIKEKIVVVNGIFYEWENSKEEKARIQKLKNKLNYFIESFGNLEEAIANLLKFIDENLESKLRDFENLLRDLEEAFQIII